MSEESKKILIVDDDQGFTQMVQYWLGKRGLESDLCDNGGTACDMIAENDYGFILMDYFLPSLKGDEACQTIRENAAKRHLPIIIMTAFVDYPKAFFLDKGATDVFYKPVSYDDLMDVVDRYIGK